MSINTSIYIYHLLLLLLLYALLYSLLYSSKVHEYYIKPIVSLFNVWIWRPSPVRTGWRCSAACWSSLRRPAEATTRRRAGAVPGNPPTWRHVEVEFAGKIMGKHGKNMEHSIINKAGWWFQPCFFIFRNIWDNRIILPIDELIFFKMVKTTNQ
jgi:hypothetical protein